jgi:cell division protein FtsN
MGRDFAKKGRHKRSSSDGYRHWLWLISGFCIGTLLTALAFYKLFIEPKSATLAIEENQTPEEVAPAESAAPTVQFDFYNLLPKLEVPLPESAKPKAPVTTANVAEPETQTAAKSDTQEYRLQLGSFKNYPDADRLKAQLALLGIQLEIEAVTLEEGDTWYRVRTIPFPDRKSAEATKAQLAAQSIKSLLLEEKNE